ncbi:MAG: T9SS type A sorting domain-containing protein [Bacteroides sp.]|nr:T9SS type A sorting domain-containing protein [Bacteroides sp.]MBD5371712.1 T9SS type A sorting domain-containing protein [Bacteroides sp.]
MRKYLLLIMLAVAAIAARGAGISQVHLHLADGSQTDIVISDDLELSFSETHLLAKAEGVEVEVPKADLLKITHSDGAGVAEVGGDEASFAFTGNALVFNGLPAGSSIEVFSMAGQLVLSQKAEGEVVVSLSDLTAGAYVVKANQTSYKILVK